MHGKPIATSFTAAILALTCALVLGAVVFSQSRAFRDSFERMAERDFRLLTEITAERLADALMAGDLSEVRNLATLRQREGVRVTILDAIQTEAKDVTDRLVDVMLVALRSKLGTWATHVETVRGIGYRLDR